jgi:hypothetical protein
VREIPKSAYMAQSRFAGIVGSLGRKQRQINY